MEVERIKALCLSLEPIAIEAGMAIMEIYKNEEDFNVEAKSDNSPLTKADKAANDIICRELIKLDSNIRIISEENKQTDFAIRRHWDKCWLVDPLDGTKEFIKRNGEFTVNVALILEGTVVAGVVYAPALDDYFYAVKGKGAYKKKENGWEKLEASSFSRSDSGLKIVCSRSHLNEATATYLKHFDNPETVAKGSSLKFLIMAEGGADIYPRLAPTMEWDTAAAQIILEEAGGSVIDQETGDPLVYNKPNLLNPHFIAYAREA